MTKTNALRILEAAEIPFISREYIVPSKNAYPAAYGGQIAICPYGEP